MIKVILLVVIASLWGAQANAQEAPLQGTVRYEVRSKTTVGELPPMMEHLRTQLEQEVVEQRRVSFQDGVVLSAVAQTERHTLSEDGGVQMRAHRPSSTTFVDTDRGVMVTQTEFMDRTFLIEEPFEPLAWRLTGETSTYLGYEVQQAVAERGRLIVEAWFAPGIPVPAGPDVYAGLPGLVLLITENGGARTYAAQEVDLGPLAVTPSPPTGGLAVTREEYQRIQAERLEQLRRVSGGNVISIRPN